MRSVLLCFLLVLFTRVGAAPQYPLPIEHMRMQLDFTDKWERYMRKLLGCPPDAVIASDCRPLTGMLDYAAFKTARDLAKRVFELKD